MGTNSVPCTGGTPNCSATLPSQTGVLVVLPGSTTEAWMAGAGYDMATGLGSVNVNNLANTVENGKRNGDHDDANAIHR